VQKAEWTRNRTQERTLVSDFRTTPIGDHWFGMRRVREVDGVAIDASFRGELARTFDQSTSDGRLQMKKALDLENARYTIGDYAYTTNTPNFTFEVFRRENIVNWDVKKRAEEDIDGVRTWRIEVKDRAEPASGTYWVDPATGRIFQAEFSFANFTSRDLGRADGYFQVPVRHSALSLRPSTANSNPDVQMKVRYSMDPAIGLVVPISMDEQYKSQAFLKSVEGHAVYSSFRRFGSDVQLMPAGEPESRVTANPAPDPA
jgi:hypothetical protein